MNGVNENYLPNSSDLFECLKSDLLQLTNELFDNWYKTYTYYLNEKDSRLSSELILNEYGDIKNDLIGYFNERNQYWIDEIQHLKQLEVESKNSAFLYAEAVGKGNDIIDYDKEHDFRASIIGPKQNLSLEERIKYYQGKTTTYRDIYLRKENECKELLKQYNTICDQLNIQYRTFNDENLNMNNGNSIYSTKFYTDIQNAVAKLQKQYADNHNMIDTTLTAISELNELTAVLSKEPLHQIPVSTALSHELFSLYIQCHVETVDNELEYHYKDVFVFNEQDQKYLLSSHDYILNYGCSDSVCSQLEEFSNQIQLIKTHREHEQHKLLMNIHMLQTLLNDVYSNTDSESTSSSTDEMGSNITNESLPSRLLTYPVNESSLTLVTLNNLYYYLNLLLIYASQHSTFILKGLYTSIRENWNHYYIKDSCPFSFDESETEHSSLHWKPEQLHSEDYSLISNHNSKCKQLVMVYDVKILLDERLKTIQQLLSTKVFQEVYVCKQLLDEIQDLARMKKFKHIGKTNETKLFNKYVYQQQYTQKLNELSDYMKKHSSSSSVLFPIDVDVLFQARASSSL